ncbi:MAG: ACT domain-containing protein [Desulfobacteraceae bacterium]|nr:ACT domain-containing protein [Desulfobacteraceae bacterium]MCF8093942.1 ACT domain-containing protein [Desulfobacteraceae bacterium]
MQAEQISIFLENKAGRLSEVTEILSDNGVNIRALALADTTDFGVLRLIVDDNAKAEEVLKNAGFTVRKTNVVAVEVKDQPGGLHNILRTLHKAQINVEYMYAFVRQSGNNAVMIFRFDQPDEAVKILSENGEAIIKGDMLYSM